MANIRTIKRRIRGVENTAKITRAMEMIAASKMRKAQERCLAGRPYSIKIKQVIADLAAMPDNGRILHPLLQQRPVNKITVVFVTPDRGLCGGLISTLNRKLLSFILEQRVPVNIVAVGNRGIEFLRSNTKSNIQAEFSDLGDKPSQLDTLPISRIIIDDYTQGAIDQVLMIYTQFISTIVQRPILQQLLPVEPAVIPLAQNVDYIYEPDPKSVLASLLPRFIDMQIYHAIQEAIASEQSARMVAMRNATDNADELITNLTLIHNKARQEMITKELLDITGGAEALD
ncbi:MAG: ATP synthase F1 subunit gamma [Chloroflexi bacterium]|nr:ATP synthase F1 subunit gamma [Chloroflexota bacterium]